MKHNKGTEKDLGVGPNAYNTLALDFSKMKHNKGTEKYLGVGPNA